LQLATAGRLRFARPSKNSDESKHLCQPVDPEPSIQQPTSSIATDPSPGAHTRPGESVEDGWHIDLPPAGCWNAGDEHSFVTGSVVRSGEAPDRIHVEFRGAGRRGFPIEETKRRRGEHEQPITTRVMLMEFSEAVLDKSLFDVPAG
jgi:hypothetical protein